MTSVTSLAPSIASEIASEIFLPSSNPGPEGDEEPYEFYYDPNWFWNISSWNGDEKSEIWTIDSNETKLRISLDKRQPKNSVLVNFSKVPKHISEIRINCCALNPSSLSTFPSHIKLLILENFSAEKISSSTGTWNRAYLKVIREFSQPYQTIPPPSINKFNFIRVIVLIKCYLETLDWLPSCLESLHLNQCRFSKIKEIEERVSLKSFSKIKQIILYKCENLFKLEFEGNNSQVESLRILKHSPRLTDIVCRNFPKTLQEVEIMGADITNKTIEKICSGVKNLTLEDCPSVAMGVERASLFFPRCQLNGFRQEILKTDQLRKSLEQSIIGQPQAIDAALQVLYMSLSGLTPDDQPAGILFFVGPSGVGKTELANAIASVGGRPLLRYDMAEYQQAHEVAKFIGSPPGYIGHEKGGNLTGAVREQPNAIVLFDEIEKAHPDVHRILLGVLDAGRLTDNQGQVTNFNKTIIIMTSNLGSNEIAALDWRNPKLALEQSKDIVLNLLKKKVAPEFAGRIDTIVPFCPLGSEAIKNIMKSKVNYYEKKIYGTHALSLKIHESVWLPLVSNPDLALGVRPVVRQFKKELYSEIGKARFNNFIKTGDRLDVLKENGKIKLELIRA